MRPVLGTQNFFFHVPCAGIKFVPLVGDIDNRLKTLFDSLRMPQHDSELPPGCKHRGGPFFCLLEDDSLITKLTVNTSQILGKGQFGPNDVELTLHVTVRPRYPMNANIDLLFP